MSREKNPTGHIIVKFNKRILFYFILFYFFNIYLVLREGGRQRVNGGGAERERRDTEAEADSRL